MEDREVWSEATIRLVVPNVKYLTQPLWSRPHYIYNLPWQIMVIPVPSTKLGLFLQCNRKSKSSNWSCYAKAELKLVSHKPDGESLLRKIEHLFNRDENNRGFPDFISWNNVLDPENCYVKDCAITLEMHVIARAPQGVSLESKKHTSYVEKNATTTATATRMLENNINKLNVKWWIGSSMQELVDGKVFYSEPFPRNNLQQFGLKLCVNGNKKYLIQLSFCVWKADFTRQSQKVPPTITINLPASGAVHARTTTLELPEGDCISLTWRNLLANSWIFASAYFLEDSDLARSANNLHVRFTLKYPEVEGPSEPSVAQVRTVGDFKTLLEDDTYADLAVKASDGTERKAHKTVLVGRSKVFHAMFKSGMIEGANSELHLNDVSGAVLDDFLKYLYLGYVPNIDSCDCKALLFLADKYDLPSLKLITQEYLYKQLNVENAADTLAVAILYDAAILKKFTLIFMVEHGIEKIMKTDGWRSLKGNVSDISTAVLEFLYHK